MHARRRLLGNALEVGGDARPALRIALQLIAKQVENDAPLLGIVGRIEVRHFARAFEFFAFVHEQRGVAAVIDDERRSAAIRPHQRLGRTPPILFERLAFPRENGDAFRIGGGAVRFRAADDDGGGGVILRRENVAADPTHVGAEEAESFDEHGGLHGHVQRAHDLRAGERLRTGVLRADRHQAGHLVLGEADLCATERRLAEVFDFERLAANGARGLECVCSFQGCGHASFSSFR